MPTIKYQKPPLVEAVFELFYISSDWSPATPGIFYNEIKSLFPKITQRNVGFGIGFSPFGLQLGEQDSSITQYRNQTDNSLVQLSNNMLTVNKIGGYTSWEDFINKIEYTLNALSKVLTIGIVDRIGLKYINKIDIGRHSQETFNNNFNLRPVLVNGPFPHDPTSIQLTMEFSKIPNVEILSTTIVTLNEEPPLKAPVFFQLYYTFLQHRNYDNSFIIKWLNENAHIALNNAFNSFLSEECRAKFERTES